WNGVTFTGNFVKTGNENLPGDNLTLTSISNKNPSPDFTIQVIGSAGIAGSKATFNGIYKQALKDYVGSGYCGPIAKEWLDAIINAIPLD
ncbi:MAG: hypothetical protein LBT17_02670, partial [Mycoplasmataceae bacterium]|nr:hypothetical protein [Mycoplasmataceae bacterium]